MGLSFKQPCGRLRRRDTVEKAGQALDSLLGFGHDAIDQLFHRGDVVDQVDHHDRPDLVERTASQFS
jgi:hypothetical protein